MIKLKDILKESSPGYENRQFGDPLPTIEDITKKYQEKNGITESTYVSGKMQVILKNSFRQIHTSLVRNVSDSHSMDDSQQSRLTVFKRKMEAARNNYIKEVAKATKPFDKEITGV